MSSVKGTTTKKRAAPAFKKLKVYENIREYELEANGLRVLYVRIPKSPTITTTLVYRVGSRNEHTGETGLSHMLEHMLFKPTSGVGPTWKDLEDKGAILNATTWLDRTIYYFTMPKEYVGDMLAVEADRMRNLILTDEEFVPERANVLSEYEMYNSRPEMALEWHMVATAFESHGYHHDTIGFRGDIERYTTEKLRSYYDRYYWPDRAVLIVAGDMPENDLLDAIAQHFGSISRSPIVVTDEERPEPAQEGMRRVTLIRETPLRILKAAFRAPAFTERDWSALAIALLHLTHGETSVLYRKLVEKRLATSVEGNVYPTKDPFLAFITISATEHATYEKIEEILFDSLKEMRDKKIPQKMFRLHVEKLLSDDIFSRDGSHAVATQLAEYVATGRWERYFEQLDELRSLTTTDVQRAVATYLSQRNATIGTLLTSDNI